MHYIFNTNRPAKISTHVINISSCVHYIFNTNRPAKISTHVINISSCVHYIINTNRPAKISTHVIKCNYCSFHTNSLNNNIQSTCDSLSAMASTSSAVELGTSYNTSFRTCIDKYAPERWLVMRGEILNPWYSGNIDDTRRQ